MRNRRTPMGGWKTVMALLYVAAMLLLAALAIPSPADAATPTCQPGSGANLAGKHVSAGEVSRSAGLKCADLRNADLTGLDLTQADLSGALATGADFKNVSLSQADLSGAKLDGANLSGADLTQATLTGADFTDADLTNAKLIQAEAQNTVWKGATLTGADVTQAELGGANFSGARGLTPWSLYVGLAAGLALLLLVALSVRTALARKARRPETKSTPDASTYAGERYQSIWTKPTGQAGQSTRTAPATGGAFRPINPPASATRGMAATVAIGVLGSLIAAFGVHLFLGGLVGSFSFAFDTLATATCSGPQCTVGVNSGTIGILAGIFVVLGGLFVRSRA